MKQNLKKSLWRVGMLPALALLLSGCYKDSKLANPYILNKLYQKHNSDATPKMPHVQLPYVNIQANGAEFGATPLGIGDLTLIRVQNNEQDFIVKSDVYWKLNWLLKQIEDGRFPMDFEESLEKTRTELALTFNDSIYALAADALESLVEGWQHRKAEETLENAGVSRYVVPWSAGMLAVESFIDEGRLGFGAKPPEQRFGFVNRNARDLSTSTSPESLDTLTQDQRQVIEIVRDYTIKYKESPTEKKQKAWQRATKKTDAFLMALRRHVAAPDHPGLDKARMRTDPGDPDYYVQPDATPTLTPRKGQNLNNAPNANELNIFKP